MTFVVTPQLPIPQPTASADIILCVDTFKPTSLYNIYFFYSRQVRIPLIVILYIYKVQNISPCVRITDELLHQLVFLETCTVEHG